MLRRSFPCLFLMMLIIITPVFIVPQTSAGIYQVTVSANKAVYNPGEPVIITIDVKKGGIPIGGATVGVTIEYPGGGVTGGSAVAIALGLYRYQYILYRPLLAAVCIKLKVQPAKLQIAVLDRPHLQLLVLLQ
jgi:hypothetical protein